VLRYRAIDRRSKGRESPPSRRNRREVPIYGKGEEKLCVATLIGSEGPFGGACSASAPVFPLGKPPSAASSTPSMMHPGEGGFPEGARSAPLPRFTER
jgi:hypothetical protein